MVRGGWEPETQVPNFLKSPLFFLFLFFFQLFYEQIKIKGFCPEERGIGYMSNASPKTASKTNFVKVETLEPGSKENNLLVKVIFCLNSCIIFFLSLHLFLALSPSL